MNLESIFINVSIGDVVPTMGHSIPGALLHIVSHFSLPSFPVISLLPTIKGIILKAEEVGGTLQTSTSSFTTSPATKAVSYSQGLMHFVL